MGGRRTRNRRVAGVRRLLCVCGLTLGLALAVVAAGHTPALQPSMAGCSRTTA